MSAFDIVKSTKLIPPLGYSVVHFQGDSGNGGIEVYRSAYPANRCFPFISKLHLKTAICLSPNDLRKDLKQFCVSSGINLLEYDIKENQEPFLVMSEDIMTQILGTICCKFITS